MDRLAASDAATNKPIVPKERSEDMSDIEEDSKRGKEESVGAAMFNGDTKHAATVALPLETTGV